MRIERVAPDQWRELRDVRLRALADAPEAFATRYEDALERTDEWWVDWAARSATGDTQAMFLARDGEAVVGLVGTFVEDGGRRWLISMWVASEARGRGLGAQLLDTLVVFASETGCTELYLEVRMANDTARRLYERGGFEIVGAHDNEHVMRKRL